MNDSALTAEQILEAAEEVLRRFGPAKTTVVDVARALGVSHGSIYRHFPSKAALRAAVARRWLVRISSPLEAAVASEGTALVRLRRWFDALLASKRSKVREDPELFATYTGMAAESREVILEHIHHLTAQVERIIADGVRRGEFSVADPAEAARAVFNATYRFHNPAHAPDWAYPEIDSAFEGVWQLMLHGLGVR